MRKVVGSSERGGKRKKEKERKGRKRKLKGKEATYCIPTHIVAPLPKETRYFSSLFDVTGSNQRPGSNVSGSGKRSGLRCIRYVLIPTTVPFGTVYPLNVAVGVLIVLGRRPRVPYGRRKPS
jgi:hypothetical protein